MQLSVTMRAKRKFQVLIGRLVTFCRRCSAIVIPSGFQVLIGRLVTAPMSVVGSAPIRVSSPYR